MGLGQLCSGLGTPIDSAWVKIRRVATACVYLFQLLISALSRRWGSFRRLDWACFGFFLLSTVSLDAVDFLFDVRFDYLCDCTHCELCVAVFGYLVGCDGDSLPKRNCFGLCL